MYHELRKRGTSLGAVWRSRHGNTATDSVGDAQSGKCVDDNRRAAGRCGRARARVLRL